MRAARVDCENCVGAGLELARSKYAGGYAVVAPWAATVIPLFVYAHIHTPVPNPQLQTPFHPRVPQLAIPLIASHIPEPSVAERQAALAAGAQHLLSKGITTVTDMGRAPFAGDLDATWRDLEEVLEPAAAARQLPIRCGAQGRLRVAAGRRHAAQGCACLLCRQVQVQAPTTRQPPDWAMF